MKTMGISADQLSVVQKMKLAQGEMTAIKPSAQEPNYCMGPEALNEIDHDHFNWMESSDGFSSLISAAPYDIVLLTDCVFALELVEHLVNAILCFCGPRTTVYCCHEIRDEVSMYR